MASPEDLSGQPVTADTLYRLRLDAGLLEVVAQYQPDQAVIEIVFVNVNPQSTLLLGQARGAAITGLVSCGLEVAEYTALQVKQAVVPAGAWQAARPLGELSLVACDVGPGFEFADFALLADLPDESARLVERFAALAVLL